MAVLLGAIKATKPRGNVITLTRAKMIAGSWHGGIMSPLYFFVSSYDRLVRNFNWSAVIAETEELLNNYAKTPSQVRELKSLLKFFQYKRWESLNK